MSASGLPSPDAMLRLPSDPEAVESRCCAAWVIFVYGYFPGTISIRHGLVARRDGILALRFRLETQTTDENYSCAELRPPRKQFSRTQEVADRGYRDRG